MIVGGGGMFADCWRGGHWEVNVRNVRVRRVETREERKNDKRGEWDRTGQDK